jgi:hypothetical protein
MDGNSDKLPLSLAITPFNKSMAIPPPGKNSSSAAVDYARIKSRSPVTEKTNTKVLNGHR